MPRYFLEVAYKGTKYSGFQIQENSNTVQSEIAKALDIFLSDSTPPQNHCPAQDEKGLKLTGSSRTDAGVHALQNFFHFDTILPLHLWRGVESEAKFIYKMNAVLPQDIVVKNLCSMPDAAHSRFDVVSREYEYHIYRRKDPFLREIAFYYPYKMDTDLLNEAALFILNQRNFFAFTKTNTQAKNFDCTVWISQWILMDDSIVYNIRANRFLRGMVRLLTGAMLQVARKKISIQEFHNFFNAHGKCGFSVPPQGLFLKAVKYPENYFL